MSEAYPMEKPPHGQRAIESFYGWNPETFLADDGRVVPGWERMMMVSLPLPSPLYYIGRPVRSIRIHRRLVGPFGAVYSEVYRAGLWHVLSPYGGAYEFRLIRGGDGVSMHGFGAAVDHDPQGNPLGAQPEKCKFYTTAEGKEVVRIFEHYGFLNGGRFSGRKDCMHFQFGTGY